MSPPSLRYFLVRDTIMRTMLLLLLFMLVFVGVKSSVAKGQENEGQMPAAGENTTYFSYKSGCNVSLTLLEKKRAVLNINGISTNGIITKNVNSNTYFDLKSNGKIIITFLYDGNDIVILNQQYQFECEAAKGITLNLINDDLKVLKDFKGYDDMREFIWDDIASMNDKAFYLEKFKCYSTSAYILEKVLLKDPERVVAWLNLADSYWALNKKQVAQKAYQKYIVMMKKQNKDLKRIPQRVNDRVALIN